MGELTNDQRRLVIFVIGFLDLLAVSLIIPAFPVYLKSLSTSSTLSGVITSIYGALQFFSSPIIGKWSDKKGRMNVMSICLIICAAGYGIQGYAMHDLVLISILRMIPGIFKHTQDISRCFLLEDKTHSTNKALGMFNAISSIGFIIGPVIHGQLVDHFGLDNGFRISSVICFFIFLVNFVISIVCGSHFHVEQTKVCATAPEIRKSVDDILDRDCDNASKLKLSAFHYGVLASRFFLALSVIIFRSSFVLWLIDTHSDISSAEIGYILSYNGFLGLCCGFLVGPISALSVYQRNEEKLQFHASVLCITSFVLMLISDSLTVLIVALATLTMSTSILRVCGVTLSSKHMPRNKIGSVQGLGSSIISISRFAAPLLVGIFQEYSFSAPNHAAFLLSLIGTGVYCKLSYQCYHFKKDKFE